jgi:hypothetical protein
MINLVKKLNVVMEKRVIVIIKSSRHIGLSKYLHSI